MSLRNNVENIPIGDLKPYARNARTHSTKQVTQIAASIKAFGFVEPILIDDENTILAGHGRVEAAKSLGMNDVPALRVSGLSDAQRRACILALNRLAEKAGWDEDILKIELQYILDVECEFSVEVTGFSTCEVDTLLDGAEFKRADSKADNPPLPEGPAVSRPGDLWLLGNHRLYCGDALETASYDALLGEERAAMVFTDPPYNVEIDGFVGGKGQAERREFVMASGEMSESEFTAFLARACKNLAAYSRSGAIHFVCMDWRHMRELEDAGRAAYSELKNLIIWAKTNGGMGSFYRSQHELIFAFKAGEGAHINNFGLGEGGRFRTNVWTYPGANGFGRHRDAELAMHPTVKPVALVADAIRDVSRRGDIVLDAFGGSGSTLIAAHKTKRRARLIELDPLYADVIVRRFQTYTKCEATNAETGRTFAATAADRLGSNSNGESERQGLETQHL